ncbi:MAG: hypothetical protein F6K24_51705 [Okeania sp. SIO2D1]|uniref:hypothetical protein n=1 Tax=Okeania sp. SIO2C9 TaxID=2607791 RepID=UPI0013B8BBB5|nr:hypothetical protein [Okeania sp. SIO2C9]NEQ75479.1 hypothetical protein [Okeania sp. SIO2C9]NES73076.1 hypothetical protein [Okeania sp. SIO2D1]
MVSLHIVCAFGIKVSGALTIVMRSKRPFAPTEVRKLRNIIGEKADATPRRR